MASVKFFFCVYCQMLHRVNACFPPSLAFELMVVWTSCWIVQIHGPNHISKYALDPGRCFHRLQLWTYICMLYDAELSAARAMLPSGVKRKHYVVTNILSHFGKQEYQCSTKNSERMLKSAIEIGEKINERVEMAEYLSSCQRCLECEIENYTRLRASIMRRVVIEDERGIQKKNESSILWNKFKPIPVEAQL